MSPPPPPPPTSRPAITAHILDTVHGLPAPNIPVTLFHIHLSPTTTTTTTTPPPSTTTQTLLATSTTDSDGRITSCTAKGTTYLLRFDTDAYYKKMFGPAGGFFPWVDVVFVMGGGQDEGADTDGRDEGERKHYHVPLLLSRFSYSTYRGS
ncbi:hypothetical protein DFH27DRAFT_481842 [Peziza echinospora]|nr:hypothetical protein DFH27DRAFT_481842 [Peziza echinospora]